MVVREQRGKSAMGRGEIKDLKTRMGWECCISKEGTIYSSGDIPARGVQGGSYSVTMR